MSNEAFDPMAFYAKAISILGGEDRHHGEALRALAAESYKRGMLRAAEIAAGLVRVGEPGEIEETILRAAAIKREAGLTDVPTVREGD